VRARRSTFVLDAWKPSLWKLGLFATIERLDPCFVAYREATAVLQRRFPLGKFVWLPHAADTTIFYPRREEKSVFCFWMGRRHEPLHQALLAYCGARGLRYLYSNDHFYSDEDLGRIASSARYFVATPPGLDGARRTGGFSPLVMRYLEGLAAGTRLLGILPRSGEYEALLPTEAICQVAPDGSDLAERLQEDSENPDAQRAVDAAGAFVRKYHSWQWRAEQINNYVEDSGALDIPAMQVLPPDRRR
jgi:glycosyltransferase involved in cell wall biosynthesis